MEDETGILPCYKTKSKHPYRPERKATVPTLVRPEVVGTHLIRGGGMMGGGSPHMGPGAMRRFAEQLDDEGGSPYNHDVAKRLAYYFKPYWRIMSAAVTTMLIYTGTVVALPLIVSIVIDR